MDSPKFLTADLKKLGSSKIFEFIATLSAPDFKDSSMSLKDLIPPPSVMGINIFFVIFFINLNKLFLP